MKKILIATLVFVFISCRMITNDLTVLETNHAEIGKDDISDIFYSFVNSLEDSQTKVNENKFVLLSMGEMDQKTKTISPNKLYELSFLNKSNGEKGFSIIGKTRGFKDVLVFVPNGEIADTTFNKGLGEYIQSLCRYIEDLNIETKDAEVDMRGEIFYDADYSSSVIEKELTYSEAYSYGSQSPFVYDSIVVFEYRNALLRTQWGQYEPYNNKAKESSKYSNAHFPIGCASVAVGQLMTFHKYPQFYDWDTLLSSKRVFKEETYRSEAVSSFLYDVACALQIEWTVKNGVEVGSTTIDNVKNGLTRMGYSFDSEYYANAPNYSIKFWDMMGVNLSPILFSAKSNKGEGHIWVIDSVLRQSRLYGDVVCENDIDGNCRYFLRVFPVYGYLSHCNWGWNGVDDGWYYDFHTDWWKIHYKANKRAIYNVKPNLSN